MNRCARDAPLARQQPDSRLGWRFISASATSAHSRTVEAAVLPFVVDFFPESRLADAGVRKTDLRNVPVPSMDSRFKVWAPKMGFNIRASLFLGFNIMY